MRALSLAALILAFTACRNDADTGPKDPVDTGPETVDADGDGYPDGDDCNDSDASIHPGADEACNELDDDCDGEVDEDVGETWYLDADGDGYGDPDVAEQACEPASDRVADASDCDDGDASVNPGADEVCNEIDDDCDGLVDDEDEAVAEADVWYRDADEDGYGDDDTTTSACEQPSGYVAEGGDCDDSDEAYNPGASEDDCADPADYNCDGSTGYADADGDGWAACEECDDASSAVNPDADELCNGFDDDCDGTIDEADAIDASPWYADDDGDGYGDPDASVADCGEPIGYVADDTDCDDAEAAIHPASTESCDGIDNDCDGLTDDDDPSVSGATTWYLDYDADGYGSTRLTAEACEQPSGYVADATDCDDGDASAYPGATEICDGADNDCDGTTDEDDASDAGTWYADSDGDGYGDPLTTATACDTPSGYTADATDCDDTNSAINPAATEVCNGIDDDCDGMTDDDDPGITGTTTWYLDYDADGYGSTRLSADACTQPSGYVASDTDCDDGDASSHPGATEICDGADNDCDGTADEDDAIDASTWYADGDGDAYGDASTTALACTQPTGHVADATDCDDSDSSINPGATEICDGVDDDCDGSTDEDDASDAGTWYADTDSDGYGDAGSTTTSCSVPSGHVTDATDCDDSDSAVNPAAAEACDGVDNDCDGSIDEDDASDASTWYADDDDDGYGDASDSITACSQPSEHVADATDCDDSDDDAYPGADERCNGEDDDCDGSIDEDGAVDGSTWYADTDGDGYGDASSTTTACEQPTGSVSDATDCDDSDSDINPAATETCDEVDNDCDGSADEGLFGIGESCPAESCAEILDHDATATDGDYWLDPTDSGSAEEYACDMTTDGGGWTRIVRWNRVDDGDSQSDLSIVFDELYNNMSTWSEATSYVQWCDDDATNDVVAWAAWVDIPNDGELIHHVYYTGSDGMGQSATFVFAEAGGTDVDLLCSDNITTLSYYSSTEQSYLPDYSCGTADTNWTWNDTLQEHLGSEITAFHLHSFHRDSSCGDKSRLYSIEAWVR